VAAPVDRPPPCRPGTKHDGLVGLSGRPSTAEGPSCRAWAATLARWSDTARHRSPPCLRSAGPRRAGPNRARTGLGPGGPFGHL
jgi:hypothetical protein